MKSLSLFALLLSYSTHASAGVDAATYFGCYEKLADVFGDASTKEVLPLKEGYVFRPANPSGKDSFVYLTAKSLKSCPSTAQFQEKRRGIIGDVFVKMQTLSIDGQPVKFGIETGRDPLVVIDSWFERPTGKGKSSTCVPGGAKAEALVQKELAGRVGLAAAVHKNKKNKKAGIAGQALLACGKIPDFAKYGPKPSVPAPVGREEGEADAGNAPGN